MNIVVEFKSVGKVVVPLDKLDLFWAEVEELHRKFTDGPRTTTVRKPRKTVAKRKPVRKPVRRKKTVAAGKRSTKRHHGSFACRKGCARSFSSPQGRALHETRMHSTTVE